MTVSPDEIRRLAALARLALDDDEVARAAEELDSILGHFAALAAIAPAADAPPHASRPPASLRPDEVRFDPLLRPPEEVAPAWAEGFFVVPRIAALDAPRPEEERG